MVQLADVKKLKVQELRDELEARSLDKTGTKPVLVERLEAALAGEPASTEVADVEPAVETATVAAVDAPQVEETEKVPSKHAPIQAPAPKPVVAETPAEVTAGPQAEADKRKARAERFGVVSDEEKKLSRAKRFGTTNGVAAAPQENGGSNVKSGIIPQTLTEEEKAAEEKKRKDRAARFNLPVPTSKDEEAAKLAERAKKFGVVTAEAEAAKKAARAARFGSDAGPAEGKDDMSKKLEERAKRFAATPADSDLEAKKKARAERFALSS